MSKENVYSACIKNNIIFYLTTGMHFHGLKLVNS